MPEIESSEKRQGLHLACFCSTAVESKQNSPARTPKMPGKCESRANHELGGCRMGKDPRTSVVNRYCRTHDVPNLYVVDGSVFPSASEKNPTHTMMALAARAADHIAGRMRKGEM